MLKQYVLAHVKPDDYYSKRFPEWNAHSRSNVKCIFHEGDSNPSLSIGLKNGGAHCHASSCGISIGNIIHFEAQLKGIPEKIAAKNLYREFVRPIISKNIVDELKQNLYANTSYILKIRKDIGLTFPTIRHFNLGLHEESHRITIPIYDEFGYCINIRYYRLPSERQKGNEAKIYNHKKGYNKLDIFPHPRSLKFKRGELVYFMAAEKESMLAYQMHISACSSTCGEGSWNPEWNIYFEHNPIAIIFGRDKAGVESSKKLALQIASYGLSCYTIQLPFKTSRADRKDFADWVIKEHGSVRKLQSLQNEWKRKHKSSAPKNGSHPIPPSESSATIRIEQDKPQLPDFVSEEIIDLVQISSNSNLLNGRIKTQGIVAAKSQNTYSIPWKFNVEVKGRNFTYKIPIGRELMRFVGASDATIIETIRRMVGSNTAQISPLEYITISHVEVIPTAVVDRDVPYVVQKCYYIGNRIEANVPYYMEVIPAAEIRSQETIGIITYINPLSKSIEKFELTPEIEADLSAFQPEGGNVWQKLISLADEICQFHTHIYSRLDLHLIALLSWCSPIGYKFPGEDHIERGWINSLVLGDTETGKSKVTKTLQQLFNCGVFVNAENCTYVGLIGGAIKSNNGQLMLRWGRIPLSDKQLVILEELSGLSIEEISNMSDVRSSGIARLDKGGINSETNSRTRLICLSNVRSAKRNLSTYLYGVSAVQELIGHGEDIARFDLITTLVDKEVSIELINSSQFATVAKNGRVSPEIVADQYRKLIHFIWSLTPNQIVFNEQAYEECLSSTRRLSEDYHSYIPIFKGGSGRYKLGRIAAAIACLQFSYKRGTIEVTRKHVEAAVKLLRMIYDKTSFGYKEYSGQMFDREKLKDSKFLRRTLEARIPENKLSKVLESLIHLTRFSTDELSSIAGINRTYADQVIGTMIRERALRKGEANTWEITPAGKAFMEKMI